jgi:hypothetical protein
MNVEPDYSTAWRDLSRRQLIFWAAFLSFVPGGIVIGLVVGLPLSALIGVSPDYFFYPVAISWMLIFSIAAQRVVKFRCPRCHQFFFAKWWCRNAFARKCVHCGLAKGANSI